MAEKTVSCLIDDLIETLSQTKASLQERLAQLEEEYKRMLEEAEKTLKDQLEQTTIQYDYWVAARDNSPVPIKKPRRKRKEKEEVPISPEEETKVVDTIYPENNETPEEEQAVEEPIQEETASLEDLFSGSGDVEATPEETAEESVEKWAEEDVVEEEPKPMDFDDWEEPEEWK